MPGFETLLTKLSKEIQQSHMNVKKMENNIVQQTTEHEMKIRSVYDEMESQIKDEERRLICEEKQRRKQIQEDLEHDLREKDRHYKELLAKHEQTKQRLKELSHLTGETQKDIEELADEKEMLEEALEETQLNFEENQSILEELQSKSKEDRRQRAATATTVSMGISTERDVLLQQLHQLKEINKKLKDERDEGLLQTPELSRSPSLQGEMLNFVDKPPIVNDQGMESDESEGLTINSDIRKLKFAEASRLFGETMSVYETSKYGDTFDDDDDGIEIDEDPAIISEEPLHSRALYRASVGTIDGSIITNSEAAYKEIDVQTDMEEPNDDSKLENPIQIQYRLVFSAEEMPESVFKVVLVGDSNVGKSAILDRFCNGSYSGNYNNTVGVDFMLRSIAVDNVVIALQLWDTAGQERYESITKQFYRKSDGVVIVYDIMESGSFLSIKHWIDNVEKNTGDDVMLMMLGNKLDLVKSNPKAIPTKNASDLSREYGALMFEVSALTGENINESFATLAKILKLRQDTDMNDAFQLTKATNSSSCCCKKSERVSQRSKFINSKTEN